LSNDYSHILNNEHVFILLVLTDFNHLLLDLLKVRLHLIVNSQFYFYFFGFIFNEKQNTYLS